MEKRKANWYYIFQQGYSLIAMPLAIFNISTTTYYLLIENVPPLKAVFPHYWVYLMGAIFVGLPAIFVLGLLYVRSEVFKGGRRVDPYSYLLLPNQVPLYEAVAKLCDKEGYPEDAAKLRQLCKGAN